MTIHEPVVLKEILEVTCAILHNNFYYDREYLEWFVDTFSSELAKELHLFERCGNQDMVAKLHRNEDARVQFTCYFASANLRRIFVEKMHFSEQELKAFETILPRYTGEKCHEAKQKCERKNH